MDLKTWMEHNFLNAPSAGKYLNMGAHKIREIIRMERQVSPRDAAKIMDRTSRDDTSGSVTMEDLREMNRRVNEHRTSASEDRAD